MYFEWIISLFNDEIGERMISQSRSPTGMRFWKLNSLRVTFSNSVWYYTDYNRFQLLQWV